MNSYTEERLRNLQALFKNQTFVTFTELNLKTGLSYGELIELKPKLEDLLREGDKTSTLISLMDLEIPGLFFDTP